MPLPTDGRRRVVIARVTPSVEGGRVPIKRCEGDTLIIRADLICDGHDRITGVLRVRRPRGEEVTELPLTPEGNDVYRTDLVLDALGMWELEVEAWADPFATWQSSLAVKSEAQAVAEVDLQVGAELLRAAADRARKDDAADAHTLEQAASRIADSAKAPSERAPEALSEHLFEVVRRRPDRTHATRSTCFPILVEPVHARFSAWYEFFPRSTGEGTKHGTFRTAVSWLPYIAAMGFDVVYLPPIHPIGESFRKGRDNSLTAEEGDPGSPWAIGSPDGGHTAVHPELGTLDDFDSFVNAAAEHGLKVALDIAFQASPDHPWVREHPNWFRWRPDGTVQYAENPPKKYQDVYPFDFDTEDWEALWLALRDVFLFWIRRGITIFRVDNPHTKPLPFWAWCLASIKELYPDTTFLSEAFTRPNLKYALAKAGFSQGYTYFTWRHTPSELRQYLEELTKTEVAEYFRPSFWPNTPDILPEDLIIGGRPAFLYRLILAGTLSSHYGIYGPAFELMERTPRADSGEYARNEKYEIKDWNLEAPQSLRPVIARLNHIRRCHPALQRNDTLVFHETTNDRLLCYSKRHAHDVVVCVVSMDPHHRQSGWIVLDLGALGIDPNESFQAYDELGGSHYLFHGAHNYVELDPHATPAHIFAIRRHLRTEHNFDYFI